MGPTKRPSPSMAGSDYPGWGAPPAMAMSHQGHVQIPYAHYAMIFIDEMGRLRVDESPSIKAKTRTFFTPEDRERFMELVGTKVRANYQRLMLGRQMSSGRRASIKQDDIALDGSFAFDYSPKLPQEEETDMHNISWEAVHQAKRRRGSTLGSTLEERYVDTVPDCPVEEAPAYPTMDRMALEIGDTEKVAAYYEMALKHFQQLNCRQMAKAFIKFIEPRKQVKHPYNGGRPPPGAQPGEKGDPEKTKPEWWPSGVVHKEPDHLKKDQRLRLLIHILRKLGKYGITSDKLKEVAHDAKRQIKPPERMEILDEIFRVRKLEERFERGEVDANAVVYVINRDSNTKLDRDSDTVSEPDQQIDNGDGEDIEGGLLTPMSSAEQARGPLTSPVDQITVAPHSQPVHVSDERGRLFQMPAAPLQFDEQSRHPPTFPSPTTRIKSGYADEFSQTVSRTSASSTVVSPSDQTGFEYLAQTSFNSTTSEEQMRQHNSSLPSQQPPTHFDAWSPNFQQNMFNPVNYNATPNQALQQHSMQYPLSMLPTSHPHEVSPHLSHIGHSLPDLHGARARAQFETMSLNPPAFRTGSLSHPHVVQTPNGDQSHLG
ncbi:hypothetical protein DTO212C5_5553 [Paecilomyces variotii]|nr:hypothetical protein DTO212C5_5553 [Paecilomyces variotii]